MACIAQIKSNLHFCIAKCICLSRKDVFTKKFCILRFYGLPDMYDSDVIEESQVYGVL